MDQGHAFDSICMRCFRTVGHRELESDLTKDEAAHICQPLDPSRRSHPAAFSN